ncbi:MAG: hypothetical protein AAB223_11455 [Pseudomonadota bacterium]
MTLDPEAVLNPEEKALAVVDRAAAVAAVRVRLHLDVSVATRIIDGWLARRRTVEGR